MSDRIARILIKVVICFILLVLSSKVIYTETIIPKLPDLIPFRSGDKWGFSDSLKNIIIECDYDYVRKFSEGLAVVKKGERYFYIDAEGKIVIGKSENYTNAEDFKGGLARVFNQRFGTHYIDKSGKTKIITESYNYLFGDFSEGLVKLCNSRNQKFGYISENGVLVIPYTFTWAGDFHCGLALVKKGNSTYYINKLGNPVIKVKYDSAFDFSDCMAKVYSSKQNNYGFIDTTGKLVIDFKFEEAGNFHFGICRVRDSRFGETYFIDRNGNIIKPSTEEIIRYVITEDFEGDGVKYDRDLHYYIDYKGSHYYEENLAEKREKKAKAEKLVSLASEEYNKGNLTSAIKYCDEALKNDHAYQDAYLYRGMCFSKLGRSNDAIQDFEKAGALGDILAIAEYYKLGQLDKVIIYADQVTSALNHPYKAYGYFWKGRAYMDYAYIYAGTKKFDYHRDRSLDNFSKAINLKPDLAEAYFFRGIFYKALGLEQFANEDLRKASELGLTIK